MNNRSFNVFEMSDNMHGTGDMASDNSRASRRELESVVLCIIVRRLGCCFKYPSSSVMAFSFSSKSRECGFHSGDSAVNSM